MASGVVQHRVPALLTVSHAPPLPVTATELKLTFTLELSLVLMTDRIWGSGLAPANGIVKLIGLTCRNTVVPTVTLTGIVMLLPVVCNASCPMNVPAV